MNLNKNYYLTLNATKLATEKELKKIYYKLSFIHHPDRGGDSIIFSELSEAYGILSNPEQKDEYDHKSKFGKFYDETLELINVDLEVNHDSGKSMYNNFKNNELENIIIEVGSDFSGSLEYERWVVCKDCSGTGRDTKSKILIKGPDGKEKYFDAVDGCDFCEGSGKDYKGNSCPFCGGAGKSGGNVCKTCSGSKRILGKQSLKNIEIIGETLRMDSAGHASAIFPGRHGYLLIVQK